MVEERDPTSKNELMDRIQQSWEAVQHNLAGLSDLQLDIPDQGGWSIKDNLAHLAAWERLFLYYHLQDSTPYQAFNLDEATFETLDEDGINAIIHQRSQKRSVIEVLAESQQMHATVVAALDNLDWSYLTAIRYPDNPDRLPRLNWVIGNTYGHYQEHGVRIQEMADLLRGGERQP